MLSHELSRFKNREVRDLAWALLSPCIIKGELIQDKGVIKSISENEESLIIWLENLDFEPNDLQTFLENKKTSKRLGKYFENLLHFAFLNLSSIRETHFSIQVKQDKSTTIGEFDFLIQSDDNSRWTHLEVAVKFYLVSEEAIGSHQIKTWFIGPNRKDRLDLKLKKLYEHQLKLGSHTCGQKKLSSLGIHSLKKELVVKGYLFYNFKMNQSLQTPDYINEYALKGWWSELHDFPFDSLQDKFFVALNKNEWLSLFVGNQDRNLSAIQLRKAIESKEFELPLLIVEVENYEYDGWREVNRGFIVQNGWRNSTATY